jgi:endonuclease-8
VPEGDSLHNIAEMLRPALIDRELTKVAVPRARGMYRLRVGDLVSAVESRGKFLEIEVERGLVLRTHLGMTGSWDLYEIGHRWRKPRHLARAVLETANAVAVCFAAPVVEVGVVGDGRLDHLGPDLCDPAVDIDECVARSAGVDPHLEIADVLLDQRIAAGIGNVYKCETLFACGLSPFTPTGAVDADLRHNLYETAAQLLQQNLGRWRRETRGDGVAVYDRAGQGCRQCLDRIRVRTHGAQGRMTFWCPTCQPER